ncbi:hypothetical protein QEN19_000798 [Hanseniaspora menglaensis]
MSVSPGESNFESIGRGRTPKISLDLSNVVDHSTSGNQISINSNMLFPVTSNPHLSYKENSNNNAIYSRRSLSRVTSRGNANSRSKSKRRNPSSDTDNSDNVSYVNTSRSNSRSRSRSVHDSNLKADLKFSILNKNPYSERIRIVDGCYTLSDSDEESYNEVSDSENESLEYSETESISSVETNAPSLVAIEKNKKNRKHKKHGLNNDIMYSSDEEKIMDVDENMFKNHLKYDFTSLVMPNTDIPFRDVIEGCKEWIELYKKDNKNQLEQSLLDSIDHKSFCNETCEKLTLVIGNQSARENFKQETNKQVFHNSIETSELPKTYIIQSDSSMESITYTIATLLKPGDQLYIISTMEHAPLVKLTQNIISITQKVLASFDQLNTNLSLEDVLVNITVLRHHYPKHFLNGMIYATRPTLIVVNMSILKGWLNGFVCGVPLLVYKREQKKRM